ncbi:MAG: alpha/beta fold hydrolase [Acutalibacteraceae bacterium]|nr:alpha/beta fold hydrolase [Acutalibacteraceae bacterium]
MKKAMKVILIVILVLIILPVITISGFRIANSIKNSISTENGIQESTYIDVNGIQQYIKIRGENTDNPVMIFIHGGPASPMGFVSAYYQKELEADLTIINYDQRGCGRTYYANGKSSDADVDMLISDLDGIVEYAKNRFGKDKVIIAGHSWGTVLGSIYIQKYPEKVDCYIGISQITNLYKNKINVAYEALKTDKIKGTEDERTLTELAKRMEKVSNYSDMSIDDLLQLVNLNAKYIKCNGEMSGMGQMWTGITSPYMNLDDIKWFMTQMDMKKFFDDNKALMEYAFFGFDISQLSESYEVPVYYIAGDSDYGVCQNDVKQYYDKITAPDKGFYMLKNTGHSPFMDNPQLYCNTIKEILNK